MSAAVRLRGQLSRNAVSFYDQKTDESRVQLVIKQQTCSVPYLVIYSYGKGPSAGFVASRAAKQMREGTSVVAHGEGIRQKRFGGELVLELVGASYLELPVSNSRYCEPQAGAQAEVQQA